MRTRQEGFTLLEAILAATLIAGVALGVYRLIQAPALIQGKLLLMNPQQTAYRGVDAMVIDLKEAYAPSINWSQIPPSVGASWSQLVFTKPVYAAGSLVPTSFINYTFRYKASSRVVVRVVNGLEQATPLLTDVDAPTATNPLFQQDSNPDVPHMLVLTVTYHPASQPPMALVRRIAILG